MEFAYGMHCFAVNNQLNPIKDAEHVVFLPAESVISNSATYGNCVSLADFPFEICNFGVFDWLFSFTTILDKFSKLSEIVKFIDVGLKSNALDPIEKKISKLIILKILRVFFLTI